jgi:hypothetical protein
MEVVFKKAVPILINESHRTWLVVVENVQRKAVNIQLTDEEDLLVLYNLQINEADFLRLKTEQNILGTCDSLYDLTIKVDFVTFPAKLSDLFNSCLQSIYDGKLEAQFDLQTYTLRITQPGKVKALVQIELLFKPAGDVLLKRYLIDKVNEHKVFIKELKY